MPENWTAWNSDNRVKETFIQISRRHGDGQLGGEDVQQGDGPRGQGGGLLTGKLKTQTSSHKILWGLQRQEKIPVSQESSLESGARAEWVSVIVPSMTSPPQIVPLSAKRISLPRRILKAPHPNNLTGVPWQRNIVQMKEQIKTPEKELSDMRR